MERLLALPRFGRGLPLSRAERLLGPLVGGAWWSGARCLKVTGSNGKGSTVRFAEALLDGLGHRTGRFTSPHLLRVEERFGLPEPYALEDLLAPLLDEVEAQPDAADFGVFEVLVALGSRLFAAQQVQHPVVEVGIGGRYDPTRLLPGRVAVLTSVDLEHTQLLGDTLEEIALDKAQLAPDGGVLVLGPVPDPVRAVVAADCDRRGVTLVDVAARSSVERVVLGKGTRVSLTLDGVPAELELGLLGAHQADNVRCALVGVQQLTGCSAREVLAASTGLPQVRLPGRAEWVTPELLVDGAYTPGGVRALASLMTTLDLSPWVLLLGVSQSSEPDRARQIAAVLAPLAHTVVCSQATHRGLPAAELARVVPHGDVRVVPDLADAVALTRQVARDLGGVGAVAGGLFLAAEVAQWVRGESSEKLI